jgi:hypothetical protein
VEILGTKLLLTVPFLETASWIGHGLYRNVAPIPMIPHDGVHLQRLKGAVSQDDGRDWPKEQCFRPKLRLTKTFFSLKTGHFKAIRSIK